MDAIFMVMYYFYGIMSTASIDDYVAKQLNIIKGLLEIEDSKCSDTEFSC